MLRTLTIFGTRPEAIKLAPVINCLENHESISNIVCLTGQHDELITPVLELFNIKSSYDLKVMGADQSLASLTAKILVRTSEVIERVNPHLVIVHGDTTSTMAGSLAAFYNNLPVAHVEAGLRTGDIWSPWPEEVNRKITSVVTKMHFAPTTTSKHNLVCEGVPKNNIYVTGNTVVDALYDTCTRLDQDLTLQSKMEAEFSFLCSGRKFILVTGHRRENFGEGFKRICQAIKLIARTHPDVDIVYPVHLNPNVLEPVMGTLGEVSNVYLIQPLDYFSFVYLMRRSFLILTDSGGVQEEAPSLGKPVLLMRETSERPEAVEAGTVVLVGTHPEGILREVSQLLLDKNKYKKMSCAPNPYGDGNASKRIVNSILEYFQTTQQSAINERGVLA